MSGPSGKKTVAGKVMLPRQELSAEAYQLLVQRLDTLENYDPENTAASPYYRELRTVLIRDTQPIKTWVYLGRQKYTAGRSLIPDGDWVNYCTGARSQISVWWQERGQNLLFGENTNQTDAKD